MTNTIPQKMERILSLSDCNDCFAIPGSESIIDVVNPFTGRTAIYGRTLEEVQQEHPGAIKMTIDAHCEAKAARQDTPVEWLESTEEKYDDMLNCLPPAKWVRGGFLVGEPWDHHAKTGRPRYQCFLHKHGKYLASSRPMTVAEFNALFI